MSDYIKIARDIRLRTLELIYNAQSSHIGSCFSSADILAVLYERLNFEKDEFVVSKGWIAAAVYAAMEFKGYLTKEQTDTYGQEGSKFIGLLEPGVHPFIKIGGGSMQLGVPAAVGFALAKKLKEERGHIYCLMSDGELAGGMIWESAAIANHHNLNNLTVIVDQNGLQAMGDTRSIIDMDSVPQKWRAFNWEVFEIDGHDGDELESVLDIKTTGPKLILARTVKGKGVSFMEGNNKWHYQNLSKEEFFDAHKELKNG